MQSYESDRQKVWFGLGEYVSFGLDWIWLGLRLGRDWPGRAWLLSLACRLVNVRELNSKVACSSAGVERF